MVITGKDEMGWTTLTMSGTFYDELIDRRYQSMTSIDYELWLKANVGEQCYPPDVENPELFEWYYTTTTVKLPHPTDGYPATYIGVRFGFRDPNSAMLFKLTCL